MDEMVPSRESIVSFKVASMKIIFCSNHLYKRQDLGLGGGGVIEPLAQVGAENEFVSLEIRFYE